MSGENNGFYPFAYQGGMGFWPVPFHPFFQIYQVGSQQFVENVQVLETVVAEEETRKAPQSKERNKERPKNRSEDHQNIHELVMLHGPRHSFPPHSNHGTYHQNHSQDIDYSPNHRRTKKKSVLLHQNRNVLPIKIRHMLSFIVRKSMSQNLIQRLLHHFKQEELTAISFYAFAKHLVEGLCYHANKNTLHELLTAPFERNSAFSQEQQKIFMRIMRIGFMYYLRHHSLLATLNSSRIKPIHKIQHIRVQRQLIEFFQELFQSS